MMFDGIFNRTMANDGSCSADGGNGGGSCGDTSIQPSNDMYKLFLETLITYGMPALFKIVVIAVSASLWRGVRSSGKKKKQSGGGSGGDDDAFDDDMNNPAAELYKDLYNDDDEEEEVGLLSLCAELLKGGLGGDDDDTKCVKDSNMNRGVPTKQWITMYNLNQRYLSYDYNITAATESKAKAAANYRAQKFDRALQLSLKASSHPASSLPLSAPSSSHHAAFLMSPHVKTKLLKLEKDFLKSGSSVLKEILSIQTNLTKDVIDDKMETMGMKSIYELDPKQLTAAVKDDDDDGKDGDAVTAVAVVPSSSYFSFSYIKSVFSFKSAETKKKQAKEKALKKQMTERFESLNEEQEKVLKLELDFISNVVELLGTDRAAGIRMALLGDISVRGSGGLLTQLQERPLTTILNSLEYSTTTGIDASVETDNKTKKDEEELDKKKNEEEKNKNHDDVEDKEATETDGDKDKDGINKGDEASPEVSSSDDHDDDGIDATVGDAEAVKSGFGKRLYVTKFPGDMMASQVNELREEVTAIVRCARPGDEALVILESGGGTVTGYGLAAGQLLRFKEKGMRLTVAVEQVAASGGYMMCCVADTIVGSPFAVFGSIGVVAQIPNVYDRLKTEGVEFQTVTAGEFKRTITPFKKVTKEDLKKTEEDIESVFGLFRDFVEENRPSLNISEVATGETWFGKDALKKNLCDEIKTVDDVLMDFMKDEWEVYEVRYTPPKKKEGLLNSSEGTANSGRRKASFSLLGGLKGLVRSSTTWFVGMVASEIRSGLAEETFQSNSTHNQYMAKYDGAHSIRVQR